MANHLGLELVGPEGESVPPAIEARIAHLRGTGTPLDQGLRSRFGALLGHDLDGMRIHVGPDAERLCRSLAADAFTVGADVFFAEGRYEPSTNHGLRLLAHELAHVVQQRTGRTPAPGPRMVVRPATDELEHEADAAAALVDPGTASAADREAIQRLREGRAVADVGSSRVIQRAAAQLVAGANAAPPAAVAPLRYGPLTCHEAVVGWLLNAEGYTRPWQLVRVIAGRMIMPQSYGRWLKRQIYTANAALTRADLIGGNPVWTPAAGDILFTAQGAGDAMHSMVVVANNPVRVRGFNNAGTFNHPGIAVPAPPGQYDNNDRDVTDVNLWNGAGTGFGANAAGADLRWVRYQNAAQQIRAALAHFTYSFFRTPGWRHTGGGGAACPPSCPG